MGSRSMGGTLAPLGSMLEVPQAAHHLVQFYGRDHQALIRNVGRFLRAGLRRGDGLLAVATLEHSCGFAFELRSEPRYQQAVGQGRLLLLDAQLTLGQCLADGGLSWDRFVATVGSALEELRSRVRGATIRIFGGMVGLLWAAGRVDAAVQLEEFWNRLMEGQQASLFCAYPIDLFRANGRTQGIDRLVCTHSHLVPANGDREAALQRAMSEVLPGTGLDSDDLGRPQNGPAPVIMARAEAIALQIRREFPAQADQILSLADLYCHSQG
jgi:MEDS: MEthanogen/methylotroph, DcmR Sensory domain